MGALDPLGVVERVRFAVRIGIDLGTHPSRGKCDCQ